MRHIFFDFETRSGGNIANLGPQGYAEWQDGEFSTEIMCFAWAVDDGPVMVQDCFEDSSLPNVLLQAAKSEHYVFHAHNAEFEYHIWNEVGTKLGWPAMEVDKWTCTAGKAAYFSLPRSLKNAGATLDIGTDAKKDLEGNALMKLLAVRKVTSEWEAYETNGQLSLFGKPVKYDYSTPSAEDRKKLCEYCRQDVVAERAVDRKLPEWNDWERQIWRLTTRINANGLPLALEAAEKGDKLRKQVESDANRELQKLTKGGEFPVKSLGQDEQLRQYLRTHAALSDLENIRKETLDKIDPAEIGGDVGRVLELRKKAGLTSVSKLTAMRKRASRDKRARCCAVYYGAQATGRFAGRAIQPQNFPRGGMSVDEIAEFRDRLDTTSTLKLSRDMGPDAMVALSSSLRSFIESPEGSLLVSDYSAIEVRVLAWLAGETEVLDALVSGRDLYKIMASKIYGVAYEDVTKAQRQVGKMAVLGCGYGMSDVPFVDQCSNMGIEISIREARKVVRAYRQAHPAIRQMWSECGEQSIRVVETGESTNVGMVAFSYEDTYLPAFRITLPSGRSLRYLHPEVIEQTAPWTVGYQGVIEFDGSDGVLDNLARIGVKFDEPDGRYLHKVFVPPKAMKWMDRLVVKTQLELMEPKKVKTIQFKGMVGNNPQLQNKRLYGPLIAQNITQAVARDLLCNSMLNLEEYGFHLIGHVHDEIIAERSEGDWLHDLPTFERVMKQTPKWAEGCPIAVEGFEAVRYAK